MRSSSLRSVTVMGKDSSVDDDDDRTQIDPRANPWAMLAARPLFSGLPKSVVDEAVAWVTAEATPAAPAATP